MPKQDWMENTVQRIFEQKNLYPTGKIKTVLDVACGLSLKSQYIDADLRIGVDIYRPFLEKIETDIPYAVINADVMQIDKLFLPKSFDLVLALDIVEHIEKDEALKLLDMAEEIARIAVIVETPKGFVPQNIDIWGHGGDTYQTHRCGWEPEEFINRGYQVILRDYTMCDVKRHTDLDVKPDITFIDAIKRLDT
ncbi:Methyltransferase type 11 domain-containing protein [Candidatus Magnetomoraceae bacterium gMMP-15]